VDDLDRRMRIGRGLRRRGERRFVDVAGEPKVPRRRGREAVEEPLRRREVVVQDDRVVRVVETCKVHRSVGVPAQIARPRVVEEVLVVQIAERRRDDEERLDVPASAARRRGRRRARTRARDRENGAPLYGGGKHVLLKRSFESGRTYERHYGYHPA